MASPSADLATAAASPLRPPHGPAFLASIAGAGDYCKALLKPTGDASATIFAEAVEWDCNNAPHKRRFGDAFVYRLDAASSGGRRRHADGDSGAPPSSDSSGGDWDPAAEKATAEDAGGGESGGGEGHADDTSVTESATIVGGRGPAVRLAQTEHSIGTCVWTAAILMSKWLEHTQRGWTTDSPPADATVPYVPDLRGKKVVELGSGTGLVGLVAAYLGADVTLTDLAGVLPNLRRNVGAHMSAIATGGIHGRSTSGAGADSVAESAEDAPIAIPDVPTAVIEAPGGAEVAELEWGVTDISESSPFAGADLVIGSDLVHMRVLADPLLETMAALAAAGTSAESVATSGGPDADSDAVYGCPVLYCYDRRGRTGMREFVARAPELFVVTEVPLAALHPRYRYTQIAVLHLRLRRHPAKGAVGAGVPDGASSTATGVSPGPVSPT